MASELTITVGLKFEKSPTTTVELSDRGSITVTGGDYVHKTQSIGFAAEEALDIGEIGTVGYGIFHNTDSTNYIIIRSATTVTTGVKLKAGEWALFRLSGNAPYAIADTGACVLEYILVED